MTSILSSNHTPPGPQALPLLGGREALVAFFRDPIASLSHLHREYGDIVAFTRQHPTWLAVRDPAANQQILTQPELFHNALFPFIAAPDTALRRLIGSGPPPKGTTHKRHSPLLQQFFRRQVVAAYADDIVALVQDMLDGWQVGARRDICQDMHALTIQTGARVFFGVCSGSDATTLGMANVRWFARATSVPVALLPINLPGTPFHALHRLSDELEARYRAIIAAARADSGAHNDVLGTLLQVRDGNGIALTDDKVIGYIHTLALGNSDTTANALIWALFLLSQHPAILADLRDEIDGVLHGGVPTADDLEQLPLLERVVKESLRLMPPAAWMMRRSVADTTLGSYSITDQTRIIYSPYMTHRLPEVYAEPQRFRPDRWLDATPPPYAYLPFGAGVHACLGSAFAMLLMRLTLAMIVQRFSLQVAPNARIDRQVQIALKPKYGMPMIVMARDARLERTPVRGNIHEMIDLA